jgi:Ni/Fe-hydrogenase subunit HybB-like protein
MITTAVAPVRRSTAARSRQAAPIDVTTPLRQITDDVLAPLVTRPGAGWWWCMAVAATALVIGVAMVAYEIATGIGVWGLDRTVGWAFDITNFVFWIGIGHAGTLISAILLLLRQQWRTSISRSAEAMTIFAVACAAVFPLIHMGRPWLAFWVLPYPNMRGPLWVNFRSPLLWDVFAINTYLTISLVFWYLGMIPDFATLRDRTKTPVKRVAYAVLSLGWDGSVRTWSRYETATTILAGLATPLVISVHSIVSMDFATSVLPGWHTTLFPPYFVAGAVFSGFAMVITLLVIARAVMHLEHYITLCHLDAMAKIMLLTGSIVAFSYATEFFNAWYGRNAYERYAFLNRATGPYAWCFWLMVACNVCLPQLLWIRGVRRNVAALFALSICANVGMWFERFVIIVTSLHRSYLPSSWTMYRPTIIEVGTLVGSFGLFFTCFLAFIRLLPMIAMWEVKAMTGHARARGATNV